MHVVWLGPNPNLTKRNGPHPKQVEKVPAFLQAVKEKKAKLMGFGHRVYKNYDPRAK